MNRRDAAEGDERGKAAENAWADDTPANPALDPEFIFGLAGLYGCAKNVSRKFDVLDLSCGTGRQLERLASQSKGLLVGIDSSREACLIARQQLARAGGRAQIVCKDLSHVDARNLGTFDLLLHLALSSDAAPALQPVLLDLIGRCMAPGAVALIGSAADAGPTVSQIEAALAPRGVEFLNTFPAAGFGALATSHERAHAADAFVADTPGVHYAVFGKIGEASSAPNARGPHLRWSTRLVHPPIGALYRAPATWHDAPAQCSVVVPRAETQAALDELAGGAKNFAQIVSGARNRLTKAGVKPGAEISAVVADDFLTLAWAGFVTPLWKEA